MIPYYVKPWTLDCCASLFFVASSYVRRRYGIVSWLRAVFSEPLGRPPNCHEGATPGTNAQHSLPRLLCKLTIVCTWQVMGTRSALRSSFPLSVRGYGFALGGESMLIILVKDSYDHLERWRKLNPCLAAATLHPITIFLGARENHLRY